MSCLQAHDDALDLLSAMMRFNPAERITSKQALKHRFFTSGVRPTSPDGLPKPKSRADAPLAGPPDGQPGGAGPPGVNRLCTVAALSVPMMKACLRRMCLRV